MLILANFLDPPQVKEDKEDVKKLAGVLTEEKVFKDLGPRQHPSFPQFKKSLLEDLDLNNFLIWIEEKTEEFQKMYGNINL